MAFSLPSYAKINWTLRVLGKRGDGFHELYTLFQTVSLHDIVSFETADELSMTCSELAIPANDRNLIMRAAQALRDCVGVNAGARIHLEKRIPSPGGLGGGSSNAAAALVGLLKLWDVRLDPAELTRIAGELGSDVPFFLSGGTAVGTGRGEAVEAIADIRVPNMLIVTPELEISTPEVFRSFGAETLTKEALEHNLTVCRKDAYGFDPRRSELRNDLEPAVFPRFPEVGRAKNTLLELGAVSAAMSGSGASVFGIFDKQETRQAAIKALAQERSWRKFAVSTVSREQYARDVLAIA